MHFGVNAWNNKQDDDERDAEFLAYNNPFPLLNFFFPLVQNPFVKSEKINFKKEISS